MQNPTRQIELLCPAGDFSAMQAAVANGASAVYFGLSQFNARERAANFTLETLPETIDYLHAHNVKGYIALNTLIFPDELEQAEKYIVAIAQAGVDAVIVQDLGMVSLIRRMAPTLAIHASTQMTLADPRGVAAAGRLGVRRAILARELSVAQIRAIKLACPQMELEVFVHGAICISFSGQCLASQSLFARSANRGMCGQACRLPYQLVVDGEVQRRPERSYPLSPRDLCAIDMLGELADAGVCAFKIEGRLKGPHYVAATAMAYIEALQAAQAGEPFELSDRRRMALAMSFSRGFSHGFLAGADHQSLVEGRSPKSRGMMLGTVIEKSPRGIIVALQENCGLISNCKLSIDNCQLNGTLIQPGDGVVFDNGTAGDDEPGGRVYSVTLLSQADDNRAARVELTFANDANLAAVGEGDIVWKTDDPKLARELAATIDTDRVPHPVGILLTVQAAPNQPLAVTTHDEMGNVAHATSPIVLPIATRQPMTRQILIDQFSRLGGTPFVLANLELFGPAGAADQLDVMAPKSVLNAMRREIVSQLIVKRAEQARHKLAEPNALAAMRSTGFPACAVQPAKPSLPKTNLHVLVRTMDQLAAIVASECKPAGVYCDFADIADFAHAAALAKLAGLPLMLATPRILTQDSEFILERIADAKPSAVLIRNLGAMEFFRNKYPAIELIGDFSLNVANDLTAALLAGMGLVRFTPAYDLPPAGLRSLIARVPVGMMEAVAYQHVPMFHMAHCPFAAGLSGGHNCCDCGRPCRKHRLSLRDRNGVDHPVVADSAGRATVFRGEVEWRDRLAQELAGMGVRHFRIELLDEPADRTQELIARFTEMLA
ncbi:MAG: U32 family peptidase [Planctomycetaceae bacterium]|nr:MAG: U32 family peptidase [Planctomycetaceae bacterium]